MGHARERGQPRARCTATTARDETVGRRAWWRERRATAGGGLSTKRARSLYFLAPPVSPIVLASCCFSPPLGVFLPRFHVGPGPSGRAPASLPAGGRWRTMTPASLLPARTHRKGTPRQDTGGTPTAASCTWESMMTARTEVHRLELGSNCLYICFASLPSLWSARCRPEIRVWAQLLMLKVNSTLLAVFGV